MIRYVTRFVVCQYLECFYAVEQLKTLNKEDTLLSKRYRKHSKVHPLQYGHFFLEGWGCPLRSTIGDVLTRYLAEQSAAAHVLAAMYSRERVAELRGLSEPCNPATMF